MVNQYIYCISNKHERISCDCHFIINMLSRDLLSSIILHHTPSLVRQCLRQLQEADGVSSDPRVRHQAGERRVHKRCGVVPVPDLYAHPQCTVKEVLQMFQNLFPAFPEQKLGKLLCLKDRSQFPSVRPTKELFACLIW